MKLSQYILVLLLTFVTFICQSAVLNLTSQELIAAQQNGTIVIDIRTPEEWIETGTIKNAKRIMFFDQQRKPLVTKFMS